MTADTARPNIFLRRPILSIVISLVITLSGSLAIIALPVAQYPELVPPTVNVTVAYPGASAETIASTVLAPLEVNINGVENMLYMVSSAASGSGQGTINVYFSLGTDPDIALVNVNNKVNLSQTQLPEEVRRQGITVAKRSPAMLLGFSCFSPDGRYDQVFLTNWMKINMVDELKRIPGVGDCRIFGGLDYAMRIWLQPDKLAKYGISVPEVAAAIQKQNSQFAPGRLGEMPVATGTQLSWQIDTKGRLVDPKQFGNIIIRTGKNSAALRLKDVAEIELGGRDYSVLARYNGMPATMGALYLQPGANGIATGARVVARLEEIAALMPTDMEYAIVSNNNDFVLESIHEVVETFFEALFLVIIVVYVFLQNWRATLIPCLAVPVSIIGTFAGLFAFGFTINTLTLFAMVLAIGLVVDDAIVVLENVERIMQKEGLGAFEATAKGMREVTPAVIGVVFSLCSVFIPVTFMGGLAGQMYKQFAITISISVILSGVVALTLTPALCALLLDGDEKRAKPPLPFRWFNRGFSLVTRAYLRIVRWLDMHAPVSIAAVLLLCGGLFCLFRILPGALVPNEDQGNLTCLGILDDGASLNRTMEAGDLITSYALSNPAIRSVTNISGLDVTTAAVKSNYGTFFVNLAPWKERREARDSSAALVEKLAAASLLQPEALVLSFMPPPISGMSTTGGFDGYIQMRGTGTLADLEKRAKEFVAEATSLLPDGQKKYPAIGTIRNLFSTGAPQLFAHLDEERCMDMGVDVDAVFTAMNGTFGRHYVNDFNYLGRTFQVVLQSAPEWRMLERSLGDVAVPNDQGKMIPLTALISFERRTAPDVVERYNVFPAAHVMGRPADGYTTGQAIAAMEEVAATLPADYSLGWAGAALQEKLASRDSGVIFSLALLMVFLVLAAQYESWSLPVSVLTAVPFGIFGAVAATWLRGLQNDVYFQIALITIIGLSAKNAILIVEFASDAWRSGQNATEAALYAARVRFRPIIMTSIAFILGTLPLAISTGAGANSRHAIGTAVIGGMLGATMLATLFVPFFFRLIASLAEKATSRKKACKINKISEEEAK
ncbi:MAG: multidrug efflux RND transporter permease subunit [Desulfovibrio sp.]|nr:multidrug efflux RND transporter permease subunit [Desulfovibrio sp.]